MPRPQMFATRILQRRSANIVSRFIATASTVQPTAARKLPTPLVFLEGLGTPHNGWKDTWQAKFAEQGYTSTSILLELEPTKFGHKTTEIVSSLSKDLARCVQRDLSYFPPIIIAHGFCTNIAEKYVESHPASGLVLVAPMNAEQASKMGTKELGSTNLSLEGSIYEPNFPILLLSSKSDEPSTPHRLQGDPNVDQVVIDQGQDSNGHVTGDKWELACQSMVTWLDEMGF